LRNVPNKRNALFFLFILFLDQATKMAACHYLHDRESITVIPGFFSLSLAFNRGTAFSLFAQLPDFWRRFAVIGGFTAAMIVLFWFFAKRINNDKIAQLGAILIFAGGVSNHVIDRLRFDAAVDFFDFYWARYHFPTFNVSDVLIDAGIVILLSRCIRAHNLYPRVP